MAKDNALIKRAGRPAKRAKGEASSVRARNENPEDEVVPHEHSGNTNGALAEPSTQAQDQVKTFFEHAIAILK